VNARPGKYFAFGPYKAEAIGPNGWWGIMNKHNINCLTLGNGRVFTNETEAKKLANEWNEGKVFEYLPDPYQPPVTKRWTDAEMSAYILSRRFVNGRWWSPTEIDAGYHLQKKTKLFYN